MLRGRGGVEEVLRNRKRESVEEKRKCRGEEVLRKRKWESVEEKRKCSGKEEVLRKRRRGSVEGAKSVKEQRK